MQSEARVWKFPGAPTVQGRELASELGVSQFVAALMLDGGIGTPEAGRRFLNSEFGDLADPMGFSRMDEACTRIHRAVAAGEAIVVYGDYDVDGMTSATLLFWVLKRLGAQAEIFIPDRASAGYGLNRDDILRLREKGASLLVTVDNGVSAVDEIAYAASVGMDVIVTDHHTLPEKLPAEAIILHPRIPGQRYPFPDLCGAGVAYKFGLALLGTSNLPDREEARERFARNCVDLVAIGTVADMAPLVGENRILVREGLRQLARTEHPGLRALLGLDRLAGLRLTTDHIGFKICPKLNAAGRIDDHRISLELLLARSSQTAGQLALRLERINQARIKLVAELMERALSMQQSWFERAFPVVVLETDKKGLVGLVAQRLKDAFHKPFLVLASDGRSATGSGRSVEGFDLIEAITASREHLTRFGGHMMAAGLTLDCHRIPAFADRLEEHATGRLASRPQAPHLALSAVVSPETLENGLLADLELLAPFGQGNPAPLLALCKVPISRVDKVGGTGKHVKLQSPAFPRTVSNVGFNLADEVETAMRSTSLLDLAFRFEVDQWSGREVPQMKLQAVRPSI